MLPRIKHHHIISNNIIAKKINNNKKFNKQAGEFKEAKTYIKFLPSGSMN